jgi:hypothetical protein
LVNILLWSEPHDDPILLWSDPHDDPHDPKGVFLYNITVPVNTTATVYIPATGLENVKEGGRPVTGSEALKWLRNEDGYVVLETGSGEYQFSAIQP